MRDASINITHPSGSENFGGARQSSGRLCDVVDDQDILSLHLADHVQGVHLGGRAAALHHDGQTSVKGLGVGARHLHAAHIGGDDDEVFYLLLPDVLHHHRHRVEVIDRDVEKALQLLGVEVHREHAIHPGGRQDISHELRRDRHTRLVLAVLTGVPEERDHRRDPLGARAADRIHHDEKLHDVVVGRRTGRLDDEDIPVADIVVDFYESLPVRERGHERVSERLAEIVRDILCELDVCGSAENPEVG